MENKFGFKEITRNNWLKPDVILNGYAKLSSDGKFRSITADEYLSNILKPKLIEVVPKEVRALFEVARGAMIYGYFFYPLFTLATEQMFRVCEAAVIHKYRALKGTKSKKTFKKIIEWLVHNQIISESEVPQWEEIRQLRNSASHPDRQSIYTPGSAIGMLESIAKQINSLFTVV